MGVAGCGKSTVGKAVADHFEIPWVEGDSLHDPASIEKMSNGEPLTDADRWPWLQRVGEQLSGYDAAAVVGCSALRKVYRQHIVSHSTMPLAFIHLAAEQSIIGRRMQERKGHFMPASLLDSQFKTLEPLTPDETGVVIDISQSVERVVAEAIDYAETFFP